VQRTKSYLLSFSLPEVFLSLKNAIRETAEDIYASCVQDRAYRIVRAHCVHIDLYMCKWTHCELSVDC